MTSSREPLFPWGADSLTRRRAAAAIEQSARFIKRQTAPSDLVTGDDPIVIYLSGRQTPPGLCDTSHARIVAGSITLASAKRDAATARLIVLRTTGRLSRLQG